jgi:hypothetical protein
MLDIVEKAGEEGISQIDLARALGKNSQPAINPSVHEFLKIGAFTFVKTKTVPTPKPEPESDLADIGIPKVVADPDEEEVEVKDDWEKPEDEVASPEGPSAADIKAAEREASKIVGGGLYAKSLSPEEEEKFNKFKTAINKRAAVVKNKKSSDVDVKVARQFLDKFKANKELVDLFKKKGLNLITYINNEIK